MPTLRQGANNHGGGAWVVPWDSSAGDHHCVVLLGRVWAMTALTGMIPIPPAILAEANRRAIESGGLTFGHGIVYGLACTIALCVVISLCAIIILASKGKPDRAQ